MDRTDAHKPRAEATIASSPPLPLEAVCLSAIGCGSGRGGKGRPANLVPPIPRRPRPWRPGDLDAAGKQQARTGVGVRACADPTPTSPSPSQQLPPRFIGKELHKKETCEAVTIIETPLVIVVADSPRLNTAGKVVFNGRSRL
ncbi:hypothetical protein E2562_016088 [Oryza meyeriana var. granulata]|uniref:Uncharacterized protein n=1 Tax=Oryza meyeriana var. granulata TaxID=110450 RepID=A0A6G1BLD9_9ORYZ|nr:hypothetical protein E2562_016088 [Oryza meyeriana var. granulata]KAF0888622.1 hypothetical protein E2562_016088 [Oryza meyeriana var. granulata]